jgi:hypothetical protein
MAMDFFVVRDRLVALTFGVLTPRSLYVRLPGGLRAHAELREQLFQLLALAAWAHRRS